MLNTFLCTRFIKKTLLTGSHPGYLKWENNELPFLCSNLSLLHSMSQYCHNKTNIKK